MKYATKCYLYTPLCRYRYHKVEDRLPTILPIQFQHETNKTEIELYRGVKKDDKVSELNIQIEKWLTP